jgi:hypothetical protein
MTYAPVTMIDDLPEMQDLVPMDRVDMASGKIRRYHQAPQESGMERMTPERVNEMSNIMNIPPPQQPPPHMEPTQNFLPLYKPSRVENFMSPLSCLDVAGHAESCPVCARLYKVDYRIFIGIIVVLVILVILLFKKVMDNMN